MVHSKIVWLLLTLVLQACQTLENSTSSPVLFRLTGQAALKTAYAHLVIPLNLPTIKESFDRFEDLEKAMNKLTSGTDYMYTHINEEVSNLKGKLSILHRLALQKAKGKAFDQVNDLNPFKDKLIESLGTRANKWQLPTPAPSSSTVTAALREKLDIVSVGTLFQLAGFALSPFNRKRARIH